ncbi:LacI family DNA-binding transcriptional regulator [Microbacterium sp.]|uniref:LacI family DNA-binding transcriptional regulator n=1 Tax=Microbacterium sp. TaxID=51671 RepID=UPI00281231B1|nr:LacI family DNA-binding transcriptional regulator [Microbacterium sp.]
MVSRSASVTIIDVAREAGVSKSAAARVLARNGSASAATRERVLAAAAKLGYRPNQLAKAMKSGSTRTIGVIVPDVASSFFSAVLRGLTDSARAAGFEVLVSNTDNDPDIEASSIDLLAEKRVDGIVIAPVFQDEPSAILDIADEGLPVVLLDRCMPRLEHLPLVCVDHADASRQATAALLKLGHRRIALITETTRTVPELQQLARESDLSLLRPSAQRAIGYLRALADAGLNAEDALLVRSGYSVESAAGAMIGFLDGEHDVTAAHATDAVLTSGAYRAFSAKGMRLPDDLSFVGFDDQDWTTLVRPAVSVVDQPRQRLGAAAATALIAAIRGNRPEELNVRLNASLLMRESAVAAHPGVKAGAEEFRARPLVQDRW